MFYISVHEKAYYITKADGNIRIPTRQSPGRYVTSHNSLKRYITF